MAKAQFGTEALALRKRVYYEGTSTIYEGMPVCYNHDTTSGIRNVDEPTVAEGSQCEGKYLRTENPTASNLQAFAGVVAHGEWVGESGPKWLDVYVPNGAIVPVRVDLDCTLSRTVLAVEAASQELTVPLAASQARPVAISWETYDRSTTSGLVLAKLDPNMFIYQDATGDSLKLDDDATAAETLNRINLNFAGTGGPKRGLYAVGEIAGAGHSNYGMWKFRTYLSAAASQTVHAVCANLHLKDDAELTDVGEFASAPLYVTVETEVTETAPTLSGGSLAAIYIGYYVDESEAGPSKAYVFHLNNHPSYNWDGLIRMSAGDLGDTASGKDEASHVVGFDGDGTTRKIPIDIDGTTYYLLVGTAIANTDD